jgi:hypothetical protein
MTRSATELETGSQEGQTDLADGVVGGVGVGAAEHGEPLIVTGPGDEAAALQGPGKDPGAGGGHRDRSRQAADSAPDIATKLDMR